MPPWKSRKPVSVSPASCLRNLWCNGRSGNSGKQIVSGGLLRSHLTGIVPTSLPGCDDHLTAIRAAGFIHTHGARHIPLAIRLVERFHIPSELDISCHGADSLPVVNKSNSR